MRILQLADFYPPTRGGLETVVHATAHALVARGHEVAVATMPGMLSPGTSQEDGVFVHRIAGWNRMFGRFYEDPDRAFHPTFPDPGFRNGLSHLIGRFAPDVIHAHNWSVFSCLSIDALPPVALALHDYGVFCAKKTNMRDGRVCGNPSVSNCIPCSRSHYGAAKGIPLAAGALRQRPRLDKVGRFLPVSATVAESFCNATQIDRSRVTVVPSFLAAETPGKVESSALPDGPFILYVGVSSHAKGLANLLAAHAKLINAPPLVVLALPGDFLVESSDSVRVLWNAPATLVMDAWRSALLGVVPSVWAEPAPLVVLEAMRAGCPIVASAVGGIPDQVSDGVSGVLVRPDDVDSLAAAMAELLGNEQKRVQMGVAARERFRLFSQDVVIDRILGVYDELREESATAGHEVVTGTGGWR